MDNIIVSIGDNVFVPQDDSNFVSPDEPVYIQENVTHGYSEPCTVNVGQTITGQPNTNAQVTNVGSEQHAVLNFVIPRGADGTDGIDGVDGLDGEAATIHIGSVTTGLPDSNAQVTNVGTENSAILDFVIPRGSQGLQGEQGVAGADGISPIAYVTQTSTGATIHIEDSENVTDATITNGTDGTDGQDGFSPIATVTQGTGSATISITDANGTTTATVYDGTDGTNGTDGTDGFSPIATVTQTQSGATISITDANGTTTANVTNGTNGTNGHDGASASVAVNSTTTGNAGTNASVTNVGTPQNVLLDFVIPRGADGADITITETSNGTNYAWKFNDGKMICWGRNSGTMNINTWYEGAHFVETYTAFADTFITAPYVVASANCGSALLAATPHDINTGAFSCYVWKIDAKTSVPLILDYVAFGHWK